MTRRPRRAGFALMLVAVYTAMTLGAWSLAARQVAALVRIKSALKAREDAALLDPGRARLRALAYGLALLETGLPPSAGPDAVGPYRCNVAIPQPGGESVAYTLTFEPVEDAEGRWAVDARPAVDLGLPGPGGFEAPADP